MRKAQNFPSLDKARAGIARELAQQRTADYQKGIVQQARGRIIAVVCRGAASPADDNLRQSLEKVLISVFKQTASQSVFRKGALSEATGSSPQGFGQMTGVVKVTGAVLTTTEWGALTQAFKEKIFALKIQITSVVLAILRKQFEWNLLCVRQIEFRVFSQVSRHISAAISLKATCHCKVPFQGEQRLIGLSSCAVQPLPG